MKARVIEFIIMLSILSVCFSACGPSEKPPKKLTPITFTSLWQDHHDYRWFGTPFDFGHCLWFGSHHQSSGSGLEGGCGAFW